MKKVWNIVVLGGSFAPVTTAHMTVLTTACQKLEDATGLPTKGCLMPSSDKYVMRKLRRKNDPDAAFYSSYDNCRKGLLQRKIQLCGFDPKIRKPFACEWEIQKGQAKGCTLESLQHLAVKYPDAEIYFLMGADKVSEFCKWPTARQILEEFHLLFVSRDTCKTLDDFTEKETAFLMEYKNRVFSYQDELVPGSSSEVREAARRGQWAKVAEKTDMVLADMLKRYYAEKTATIPFHTVAQHIADYFINYLPEYDVTDVASKSTYPDDHYLYMVAARHAVNHTYTLWTCWNEKTQSLNHGFYSLASREQCIQLMREYQTLRQMEDE